MLKNSFSDKSDYYIDIPEFVYFWFQQITPKYPRLREYAFPSKAFIIVFGSSTKSILVKTPTVLIPFGSNSHASFNASELATSILAEEIAKIIELGFWIYYLDISSSS